MLREIPNDYWPEFFAAFNSEHRGLPVTLERRSAAGTLVEAQNWPLRLLLSEAVAGHRQISILVGEECASLMHVVEEPARVRVLGDDQEEQLEMEAADGTVCVIHLARKPERQPKAAAAS
jgi:hypothetical protein